jgi:hypothetical protein
MNGSFVPSTQEYFHYYGLDQKKLSYAKPDALVMHPGPMNRGVEIDSAVADGAQSLIREHVEMGVEVDEPRAHHEPGHVEDLRPARGHARVEVRDLAVHEEQVQVGVDGAAGVDHAAALEEETLAHATASDPPSSR